MAKTIQPGYWAVIPANIRYDRQLTTTAKLLYAEISSMAQVNGYCWATDKYFADLFICSVSTITRSIRSLADGGYIRIEKTSNIRGLERRIFCGVYPAKGGIVKNDDTLDDIVKNDDTPIVKNDDTPPSTHINRNNKRENTRARENEHSRKASREVQTVFQRFVEEQKAEPTKLLISLMDFADSRRNLKKPMTGLAATRLAAKLHRLSGGRVDVMIAMLDKAIEMGWTSVYPLKADEMPQAAGTGDGIEERPGVEIWTPGGGSNE